MPPIEKTAASSRPWASSPRDNSPDAVVDLTKEERSSMAPAIDPSVAMPPSATPRRKRSLATANASPKHVSAAPSSKARRIKPLPRSKHRSSGAQDTRDPFDVDAIPESDGIETLDVSKSDEVPEELTRPKVDNREKLAKFQCIICMDNVSNLTVTHCGHLFCSECLHSSLYVDNSRKVCPVCRTRVEVRGTNSRTKFKTFYPLELKLMTRSRRGKRPASG